MRVENSSDSTDYEDNQFFIGSVEVEVETKQLTELNSSENNITPEKDQLTELDSSENNFVEDNDSLKHLNDQIGAKQNSPDVDQIDIENSYFVNGVDSEIDHSNDWILPLQKSGTDISFKLDTGAQCNIIPRKVYDRIKQRPRLHEAKAKLTSYNGGSIEVQGKCIVRITGLDKPEKSYPVQCFVVPTESPPILGLETCKRLI